MCSKQIEFHQKNVSYVRESWEKCSKLEDFEKKRENTRNWFPVKIRKCFFLPTGRGSEKKKTMLMDKLMVGSTVWVCVYFLVHVYSSKIAVLLVASVGGRVWFCVFSFLEWIINIKRFFSLSLSLSNSMKENLILSWKENKFI